MNHNYDKSKRYENVWYHKTKRKWKGRVKTTAGSIVTFHDTEEQAAMWVDVMLIRNGASPINKLKKCQD